MKIIPSELSDILNSTNNASTIHGLRTKMQLHHPLLFDKFNNTSINMEMARRSLFVNLYRQKQTECNYYV